MEDSTYSLVEDAVPETERGSNVDTSLESQDTNTFISSSSASRFSEPGSQTERAGTHERTGQRHSAQTPALEGFSKSTSSPPSASSGHLQPVASGQEHADSLERDVLKGICNTPQRALSANHLHFQGKPDVCEEILDSDEEMCPEDMRVYYHDAVILYQELNKSDVEKFKQACKQVQLKGISEPVIALYDEILPDLAAMTLFDNLELALSNCEFVFLYITEEFCTDAWSIFSSYTSLNDAIHDPSRKWSVVPVFTAHKHSTTYRIPKALKSFRGFNFFSEDKCDFTSLTKMLESRLSQRLKKQELKNQKRRQWIMDEKEKRENLDAERRHKMKKQHVRVQKKDSENNCPFELENQPDKIHRAINPTVQQNTAGVSTEEDAGNDTCATSPSQTPTETTNRSSEPPASATNLIDETAMQSPEDVSKMKDVVDDTNAKSQSQTPTETTDRCSEPPASATNLIDETAMQSPEDVSKMKDVVDDTNAKSQSQTPTETTDRCSEPPASATNLIDETAMQNHEDVSKTKDDENGTKATAGAVKQPDKSDQPRQTHVVTINRDNKDYDTIDALQRNATGPPQQSDSERELKDSSADGIVSLPAKKLIQKVKNEEGTTETNQQAPPRESTDLSLQTNRSALCVEKKESSAAEIIPHCSSRLNPKEGEEDGTAGIIQSLQPPGTADPPPQESVSSCVEESKPNVIGVILQDSAGVKLNQDEKEDNAHRTVAMFEFLPVVSSGIDDSASNVEPKGTDGVHTKHISSGASPVKGEVGCASAKSESSVPVVKIDPPAQLPSAQTCGKNKDVDDDQILHPAPADPNLIEGEIDNSAAMSWSTPPTEIKDHPPHPSDSCDIKKNPGGSATVQQKTAGVSPEKDAGDDACATSLSQPPTKTTDRSSEPHASPTLLLGENSDVSKTIGEVDDTNAKSQSESSIETTDCSLQPPVSATCVLDGTAQQISERVSKNKDDVDGSKATSGTLIQTENSDQPKQTHVATTDRGNTIYFTTEAFQRHLTGPQQPSDSATQGEGKDSSAHSSTYFSQEVNGGDDTRKTIQPPAPRDSTDPCVQETSSAIGLEGKESSAAEGISDFSTNLNPREEDEDCTGGIIQSLQLPGTADPPTQESASFCVEERRAPITGVITQESPDVRFKEDQKEDRIVTMTESHDTCATSQYQSLTETIDRSSQPPASATNLLDETSLQNLETVSKTKDDVDSTNSTSQSLSSTDRSSEPLASATLLVDEKSLQNPGDVSKTKDDVATIDPSPQLSSSQICVESKKEGVHTAVQMTADLCPKEGKGDNANAQSCSRQPINPKKTRHRHVGQSHLARTREEGISRHTEAVPRETFQQAYQQHTSVHPETARPVASTPPSQHYQPMYPDLPQSQQLGLRHPLSEYHRQPGHGAHSQQYFHQHGDSHPLQSLAKAVHSNDGLPCGKKRARHEKKCMPQQSAVHVHYHNVKIRQADFVNISQQTDVVEERTSFTRNRDDPSRMDQDQELSEDSDTNCKLLHDGPASADIPTYDFNLPPDITTDDFTLPPGEFLLQPNSEQEAGSPDKDLRV
ncbi:serine-rich adhesin for platelets-like isoform X2 [Littorina saxatilis]|uniref:serine-rich adhesin for platelets-like isoform X2 n=1 Tax=Littorina saxatilis TaxID=31220 RepID=UPI0038B5529A